MPRSDTKVLHRRDARLNGHERQAELAEQQLAQEQAQQVAEHAREQERREIAHELHDTVIQPLAALVTSFECLQRQSLTPGLVEAYLGAWKELAQEAIDSLRGTLAGLLTHPHAQLGLPDALRRYLAPHVRSRGLRLALEAREWPVDTPLDLTSSLYLVLREALTNVEKHAHATEASVLLEADAAELRLFVADNGVGFCQEEQTHRPRTARGQGVGLGSMRERVARLGGQLRIVTSPGHGVRLEMIVPRPPGARDGDVPSALPHPENAHTPPALMH